MSVGSVRTCRYCQYLESPYFCPFLSSGIEMDLDREACGQHAIVSDPAEFSKRRKLTVVVEEPKPKKEKKLNRHIEL